MTTNRRAGPAARSASAAARPVKSGLPNSTKRSSPVSAARVVRPKVLVERAVALLQAQRGQRAAAEVRQSQVASCLPQLVVERCEIVRRGPDLVAELTGEAGARQDRRGEADRGLHYLEQLERRRRQIGTHQPLHQFARSGTGDREAVRASRPPSARTRRPAARWPRTSAGGIPRQSPSPRSGSGPRRGTRSTGRRRCGRRD